MVQGFEPCTKLPNRLRTHGRNHSANQVIQVIANGRYIAPLSGFLLISPVPSSCGGTGCASRGRSITLPPSSCGGTGRALGGPRYTDNAIVKAVEGGIGNSAVAVDEGGRSEGVRGEGRVVAARQSGGNRRWPD